MQTSSVGQGADEATLTAINTLLTATGISSSSTNAFTDSVAVLDGLCTQFQWMNQQVVREQMAIYLSGYRTICLTICLEHYYWNLLLITSTDDDRG